MWCGRQIYDNFEKELAEEDDEIEAQNINNEDVFFGDGFVTIENARNDDYGGKQGNKFGGEVVWICAIDKAVVESPEENWGEGDFDMFPSAFINCGKKADDFIMICNIV